MRKIITISCLLLFLITGASTVAWGQNTSAPKSKEILINVSVLTRENQFVSKLKEDNFRIREGKEIKKITSLVDSGPASVVFVVDTSTSMDRVEPGLVSRTAGRFIRNSNAQNEYATIRMGDTVEMLQGLTTDYDLVKSSFAKLHETPRKSKASRLFDAIIDGFNELKGAKNNKRILILLSDLVDSGSKAKFSQIKELAKQSNVIIYSIIPDIGSSSALFVQSEVTGNEISYFTGGLKQTYYSTDTLDFAVDMVVLSIQQMYIVGFEPSIKPGEWREIEVSILTSKELAKNLIVRSRKGYHFKSQ